MIRVVCGINIRKRLLSIWRGVKAFFRMLFRHYKKIEKARPKSKSSSKNTWTDLTEKEVPYLPDFKQYFHKKTLKIL